MVIMMMTKDDDNDKDDCDDKYDKVNYDDGKHEDESDLRRNDQVDNDPQPVVAVCHVLKMKINPIKLSVCQADTQNFYPILTSTRSLCTIIEVYCLM